MAAVRFSGWLVLPLRRIPAPLLDEVCEVLLCRRCCRQHPMYHRRLFPVAQVSNNFLAAYTGYKVLNLTGNYGWGGLNDRVAMRAAQINSTGAGRGDYANLTASASLMLDSVVLLLESPVSNTSATVWGWDLLRDTIASYNQMTDGNKTAVKALADDARMNRFVVQMSQAAGEQRGTGWHLAPAS